MCWKNHLRHLVLLVCLACSQVPLATAHLKAESFPDVSSTATKTFTAAPSLSSEEAIEYLKRNGKYQSLQEAFAQAQALASIQQEAYLKASNTDANDVFGASVAISGDTVVVGAPDESSNATGVNGNQADNSLLFSGAVYIFVRNGNSWSQQAYLKSSNPDAGDGFGSSVTIDGDTLVVGAPYENSNAVGVNGNQNDNSANDSGAVYVFVRNGSTWSQQAYLKASNTDSNDRFGTALDISGDTILIGAQYEKSNATGINGDQSDNSAINAGAAYIFVRNGTTWSQQAYVKSPTAKSCASGPFSNCPVFGSAVDIAGDTVAIASNVPIAADIFVRNGVSWSWQASYATDSTIDRDLQLRGE